MYNPLNTLARFVSYMVSVAGFQLSASTIENSVKRGYNAVTARYHNTIHTMREGIWMLRAQLAGKLYVWSEKVAPTGYSFYPLPAGIPDYIPVVIQAREAYSAGNITEDQLADRLADAVLADAVNGVSAYNATESITLTPIEAQPVYETAPLHATPHVKKLRVSKGKTIASYKAINPGEEQPGERYWYKTSKKRYQEMIAPLRKAAA